MADNTPIEWTDATVNATNGCTLVDEGCRHCYAARLAATRMKSHPTRAGLARINAAGEAKFTGEVRLNEAALVQPLAWKRPRRIFWNAHGDTFHEAVPDEWIDRMFAVMALTPHHTHQVLTKRPDRTREYMAHLQSPIYWRDLAIAARKGKAALVGDMAFLREHPLGPLPNVWLGTSASDQASADARIPDLLATPAAVRFLSVEPMLGEFDIAGYLMIRPGGPALTDGNETLVSAGPATPRLDWVICGGESGPHARPMHPDWARSLRDQCVAAGVPFLFKQWGEWELSLDRDRDDPDWRCDYANNYVDRGKSRWLNLAGGRGFHGDRFCVMRRVGKRAAGRLLDGRTWDQFPEPRP